MLADKLEGDLSWLITSTENSLQLLRKYLQMYIRQIELELTEEKLEVPI